MPTDLMGQRIFLYTIMLGSFLYGILAVQSAIQAWRVQPQAVQALEQAATPAAQRQAQYLQSPWYQGQLLLALASGALFLIGAAGLWLKQSWSRLTLFGGAWMAMAQTAWTLITSFEWFRASGAGMAYQMNLCNIAWVLLILAVAPTERLVR